MPNSQEDIQLIRMLSERLERISADSIWAHRASGVRGALLRILDQTDNDNIPDSNSLTNIVTIAFNILSHAARRS